MNSIEEFRSLLDEHLHISREVSRHFLKIGKNETSTIVEHEVTIIDGHTKLKTVISLLPVRRMRIEGTDLVEDNDLVFEMTEDVVR